MGGRAIKIGIIFGTRPEAIKMAPLILELQKSRHEVQVANSGQHRELLDPVLKRFGIVPNQNFSVMQSGGTLTSLMQRLIEKCSSWLSEYKPDVLLVHGDTTTAMISAITAHNLGIKVGHVEAGLRTDSLWSPWPEESNRRIIDSIAELCFCPTSKSSGQLVAEGKSRESVYETGNTVIDAIMHVDSLLKSDCKLSSEIDAELGLDLDRPFVLVTQHRRESFGGELEEIFEAILETSNNHPEVLFLIPLHKNPNVEKAAQNTIRTGTNIKILKSLDYFEMVRILQNTILVVTDSGGLQEEAPSMNIPVLITRKVTERPEVVEVGAAKLVGTSRLTIVKEIDDLLNNSDFRESMRHKVNPFGDGKAALKIVSILDSFSDPKLLIEDHA